MFLYEEHFLVMCSSIIPPGTKNLLVKEIDCTVQQRLYYVSQSYKTIVLQRFEDLEMIFSHLNDGLL